MNEQKILEAVQRAGSYEEAIQAVLDLYPDMDMSGLEDMMERGIFTAEMFGQYVV